jgi:hypothetical protein
MCLEGMWSSRLTDRSSVLPVLELLERQEVIEYIHRDAGTIAELDHYLNKWLQKGYARFGTAYLAFHGEPGALLVGRSRVTLDDLAEIIDRRAEGRVLFLGGCAVLDQPKRDIKEFVKKTRLRGVCGYLENVDWIESAAFEILLIEALTRYKRIDAVHNWMRTNYAGFCRRLEFKLVW